VNKDQQVPDQQVADQQAPDQQVPDQKVTPDKGQADQTPTTCPPDTVCYTYTGTPPSCTKVPRNDGKGCDDSTNCTHR